MNDHPNNRIALRALALAAAIAGLAGLAGFHEPAFAEPAFANTTASAKPANAGIGATGSRLDRQLASKTSPPQPTAALADKQNSLAAGASLSGEMDGPKVQEPAAALSGPDELRRLFFTAARRLEIDDIRWGMPATAPVVETPAEPKPPPPAKKPPRPRGVIKRQGRVVHQW